MFRARTIRLLVLTGVIAAALTVAGSASALRTGSVSGGYGSISLWMPTSCLSYPSLNNTVVRYVNPAAVSVGAVPNGGNMQTVTETLTAYDMNPNSGVWQSFTERPAVVTIAIPSMHLVETAPDWLSADAGDFVTLAATFTWRSASGAVLGSKQVLFYDNADYTIAYGNSTTVGITHPANMTTYGCWFIN